MDRRRLARFVLVTAALFAAAAFPSLARSLVESWPKEQTVHYILGSGAERVQELDARWIKDKVKGKDRSDGDGDGESVREVDFRYARGAAPRIATHEPRLPDGDYTVEIDVTAAGTRSHARRRVTLGGGVTSIDLTALAAGEAQVDRRRMETP